jgi:Loader and inhibitor of phage G40P
MQRIEALNLVAMLIAAYPSWKSTEETQRLYAGFIEQLDYDVAREALREVIESPRDFVPPVGLIVSRALEKMRIVERDRRLAVPRKYKPGEVRYDPKGRRYVADANGDLRFVQSDETTEDLSNRQRAS